MLTQSVYIFVELLIEGVTGHRRCIAQDDQLHAGTGNGYVHTAQVTQKTDLSLVVGSYQ